MAYTKIYYPDKIKERVASFRFSDSTLEKYSIEALTQTYWISGPITLVTDRDPDNVLDAFGLLQSLDTEVVTNPVGEKTIIHVKSEHPKIIPAAEVFAVKTFVVETFEGHNIVIEEKLSRIGSANSPLESRKSNSILNLKFCFHS